MRNKYRVQLSIKAKNDFKKIIMYIKNELQEPEIAKKYFKIINKELGTLEYNPQRFTVIDIKLNKQYEIRKLLIKNYLAFYSINENESIVNIERILYGASNWKDKI